MHGIFCVGVNQQAFHVNESTLLNDILRSDSVDLILFENKPLFDSLLDICLRLAFALAWFEPSNDMHVCLPTGWPYTLCHTDLGGVTNLYTKMASTL